MDDLIDAKLCMMDTGDDFVRPVYIGNSSEHTMLELPEMVLELTGSTSGIVNKPTPQDYPKQRAPDIRLLRSILA